jgi:hypothetical protein
MVMKKIMGIAVAVMVVSGFGCTTNMKQKAAGGAATGAVSAAFVGGVTDLILHGEISGDTLTRNLVGGAVGGATAGAAIAHKQDKKAAQDTAKKDAEKLADKIGKSNYDAFNDLLNYKYAESYAKTIKVAKSGSKDEKEIAYVIQALIDKDRGNAEGTQESLAEFVKLRGGSQSKADAEKALNQLHDNLNEQRKIQGIRKP